MYSNLETRLYLKPETRKPNQTNSAAAKSSAAD